MDTFNYLHVVIVCSFWGCVAFWGMVIVLSVVIAIGNGIGVALKGVNRWMLNCDGRWVARYGKVMPCASRGIVYVVIPLLTMVAAGFVYWQYFRCAPFSTKVMIGEKSGDPLVVDGIGLRWIDDGKHPCWMMDSEVSAELWKKVLPKYGQFESSEDRYPVVVHSRYLIRRFVREMNRRFNYLGWRWSLPTEAQWLTAWRAGHRATNMELKLATGWLLENSDDRVHECRSKAPNAWGLYDMIGNVGEYCEEEFCIAGWDWASTVDEEEPSVLAGTNEEDDDVYVFRESGNTPEGGLRLCLNPTALARCNSGRLPFFQEDRQGIAFCNFVLLYGLAYLLFQLIVTHLSKRIRNERLRRILKSLSVFDEWESLINDSWKRKLLGALKMAAKGMVEWLVGLFVVSPASLLIPGLPTWALGVPEALLVVVVGAVLLPIAGTCVLGGKLIRDVWRDCEGESFLSRLQTAYRCGFLPVACVFTCLVFADAKEELKGACAARRNRTAVMSACGIVREERTREDVDWSDPDDVVEFVVRSSLIKAKVDVLPGSLRVGDEYCLRGVGRNKTACGPTRRGVRFKFRDFGVVITATLVVSYYRSDARDLRITSATAEDGVDRMPALEACMGMSLLKYLYSHDAAQEIHSRAKDGRCPDE